MAGNKRWYIFLITTGLAVTISFPGCQSKSVEKNVPAVAVTTTYFESTVRDVAGPQVQILRMLGPGGCPGHFDIRPSQVSQLRNCRVLIRFDFQKTLDAKLSNVMQDGLEIYEVKLSGGLCELSTYISACEQTGSILEKAGLVNARIVKQRIARIKKRFAENVKWARQEIQKANLVGRAVIASSHQESFCKWLGLNVVATFPAADQARFADINKAVEAGKKASVKLIIGNLPEGRQLADALADRLDAKVVVFGNFPEIGKGKLAFDKLFRNNVNKLVMEAGR